MLHVLCSTLFLRTKKHPHGQTPHGCLLLVWWSIGGRALISLFRAPLYRKVGKKLATNIKFHCAPAIGLDFYQVYFLCAGGKNPDRSLQRKRQEAPMLSTTSRLQWSHPLPSCSVFYTVFNSIATAPRTELNRV